MARAAAVLERLRDKGERLRLASELSYNVPRFVPLRAGVEFKQSRPIAPEQLHDIYKDGRIKRLTIRTYRPLQTVGSEPLFLNVRFEEALLLANFAIGAYAITKVESLPPDLKLIFDELRLRADASNKVEGYSFGREFYKLLSRNRDGAALNVLFQEYIDRDHAERSGRIAFYRDGTGVYSYKAPEAGTGPIVRDVDYSRRGIVSGSFSRVGQIPDEVMRTRVAQPLQALVEMFPWRQGVVIEFDYHSVPVGQRQERLIIYDFHEADVTIQDVTGSGAPSSERANRLMVVSRTKGPIDPKEVAERILVGLADRRGAYVSGPITTGLEFYKLLKQLGIEDLTELSEANRAELRRRLDPLVQKNIERMAMFAEELGSKETLPIINPAEIAVSDWSQDHYMALWTRVIELGVERIYFLDGWEYSNGAAAEYCLGANLGLGLLSEHGKPISKEKAATLMRNAVRNVNAMGFDVPALQEAISRLSDVTGKP